MFQFHFVDLDQIFLTLLHLQLRVRACPLPRRDRLYWKPERPIGDGTALAVGTLVILIVVLVVSTAIATTIPMVGRNRNIIINSGHVPPSIALKVIVTSATIERRKGEEF